MLQDDLSLFEAETVCTKSSKRRGPQFAKIVNSVSAMLGQCQSTGNNKVEGYCNNTERKKKLTKLT